MCSQLLGQQSKEESLYWVPHARCQKQTLSSVGFCSSLIELTSAEHNQETHSLMSKSTLILIYLLVLRFYVCKYPTLLSPWRIWAQAQVDARSTGLWAEHWTRGSVSLSGDVMGHGQHQRGAGCYCAGY